VLLWRLFLSFGFTGELQDPTTQLVYLRARHYDPAFGRFLQRDSFPGIPALPRTLNRYV
jgi:RHS repeat-associated protein